MKFLITGANGLTGQKIIGQLLDSADTFLATSVGDNRNPSCPQDRFRIMDITNPLQIKEVVEEFQPDTIINTAAMTNVDACEEDVEGCRRLNVDAVENLLNVCKLRNIHLVHLSTDFVFDGANGPYAEDDERNPLSVYATSKYDAENILMESTYKNWSILRTIIVFGRTPNMSRSNIVLWAIDALKEGQELTIVDDQFRAPTWADDLATACISAGNLNAKGVFHISGPETFSIHELVSRIATFLGCDTTLVKAISSETLNQKAARPARTGFIIDKARNELKYQPLNFEECLSLLVSEQ